MRHPHLSVKFRVSIIYSCFRSFLSVRGEKATAAIWRFWGNANWCAEGRLEPATISAALADSAGDVGKVPMDEISVGFVMFAVGVAARPEVSGVGATKEQQGATALRLIGVPGLREHSPQLHGGEPWRKLLFSLHRKWTGCRTKAKKKAEFFDTLLVAGAKPFVRAVVDVGPDTPHATAAVDAADDEEMVEVMDSMHGGQLGAWADGRALWPQADSGQ